jgi:multicomponent Na+:H+ antiporter subunit D
MIGAPPVAGFVTKLAPADRRLDAHSIGILLVLLASTLLNAAYFVPVVYQGFFGRPSAEDAHHPTARGTAGDGHPALPHRGALRALGFYPDFFMQFAQAVVK